jgi:hypothetical protein
VCCHAGKAWRVVCVGGKGGAGVAGAQPMQHGRAGAVPQPPTCGCEECVRSVCKAPWWRRQLPGLASVDATLPTARPPPNTHTHTPSTPDLLTPQASFDAIAERLIVGPVVRELVYNKIPNTVCDWVDAMCADWRFERIIPAHFAAPVRAGARARACVCCSVCVCGGGGRAVCVVARTPEHAQAKHTAHGAAAAWPSPTCST